MKIPAFSGLPLRTEYRKWRPSGRNSGAIGTPERSHNFPPPGNTTVRPSGSPDSQYLLFVAQGKLKKIAVAGGPAQALCNVANFAGASWSRDGVILFAEIPAGIFRVAEGGGAPTLVTKVEGETG